MTNDKQQLTELEELRLDHQIALQKEADLRTRLNTLRRELSAASRERHALTVRWNAALSRAMEAKP